MQKIAVLTEYYNSKNYGGNLQAYALTRFLNENGYAAEQLPYKKTSQSFIDDWQKTEGISQKNALFKRRLIQKVVEMIKKVIQKTIKRKEFHRVGKRNAIVVDFGRKQIPHNEKVYIESELQSYYEDPESETAKALRRYSIFITGSDQVWRSIDKKAYFLTFVPEGKKKLSYAASISKETLDSNEEAFFREALNSFDGISVREKSDAKLLSNLSDLPIEWVLDPTLLLEEHQWNEIASPRLQEEKYVFCYFLGSEKRPRMLAREYAKIHNLSLITIPYLTEEYPFMEYQRGRGKEKRLFEVGVGDFLSLIKYADAVFTDSFHAVVFSGIYKRQYYVFVRAMNASMSTRIESILEIYETTDRFCNSLEKETLAYLESTKPIDYSKSLAKMKYMKERSKAWLIDNIRINE